MRVSRLAFLVAALTTLGGAVYGIGYSSRTDPFTGSTRDWTLWAKDPSSTGRLLQQNGHLYYDSGTIDPVNVTGARWYWKPAYVLIDSDILDLTALVRMPPLGILPGDGVQIGIGLKHAYSSSILHFVVEENSTTKNFILQTQAAGGGAPNYVAFPVPTTASRFYIRLRYNNGTQKATFYWRNVNASTWTKIGYGFKLPARWGLAGSSLAVKCMVEGYSFGRWTTPADGVYLDNVTVENRLTPP